MQANQSTSQATPGQIGKRGLFALAALLITGTILLFIKIGETHDSQAQRARIKFLLAQSAAVTKAVNYQARTYGHYPTSAAALISRQAFLAPAEIPGISQLRKI